MRLEKGIALAIVLCLILVFVTVATFFMLISGSELKMASKQNDSTKAFYLAEAGFERTRHNLGKDIDWTDGEINGVSYDTGNIDETGFYLLSYDTVTRTSLGGEFTVRLKDIAGLTDAIWVKSKGTYNNSTRTIKAKVTKASGYFGSPSSVTLAIRAEGNIDLTGNAEITPSGSYEAQATFDLEDIFGVDKPKMKQIAQHYYPETYYQSTFNNEVATGVTWIEAPGTESQITMNGWIGNGILIVNGDLKITGGLFNGVIWVIGALTISGNPEINGGIFVEGGFEVNTTISGTANINYSYNDVESAFYQLSSLPPMVESWQEIAE